MKICNKCNIEKSLNEFYFDGKRNLYLTKCRECYRLYQASNKEKNNAFQKEYYQLNKDKHKKRCKEWMGNNKQYAKKYRTQYYQSNRDILLEKSKEYQINTKKTKYE
jgi:hypothetical protein